MYQFLLAGLAVSWLARPSCVVGMAACVNINTRPSPVHHLVNTDIYLTGTWG